jgi:hypothetical protein
MGGSPFAVEMPYGRALITLSLGLRHLFDYRRRHPQKSG